MINPSRRTIRPGNRVADAHGTGAVRGNTGLPPLCDPRDWTWIDWDGDRGLKVARIARIARIADIAAIAEGSTGAGR